MACSSFLFSVHFEHFHYRKTSKTVFSMKEYVLEELLKTTFRHFKKASYVPPLQITPFATTLLNRASSLSATLHGNAFIQFQSAE